MKKILSLVLVFALVLGSFGTFAATDEQVKTADILKGYKVLVGNESGDLMLDENMTREQALVVLARFMGVEDEAASTGIQSSFTDVDHPYYEPFIAYAELKGWTNGIGEGTFGYGQDVTVQQFVAYMLRALGYGNTPWEDTMKTANELKLFANSGELNAEASIVRGEAALVMNDTLETKPTNNDMALKYVLGLVGTDVTGDAVIKNVVANNLKQLVVTLSAPIKEAGDEDNWSVKSDEFDLDDATFELSEDGMTVTITFAEGEVAKQQEVVDLTVEGLLKDDFTFEDIQFLDVTIPEVVDAKVIGIDTVKVMFSEPIRNIKNKGAQNKKNYEMKSKDGTKYNIKRVELQNEGREALIEFYANLKEGEYTLDIDNDEHFSDFQDYTIKNVDFNLEVVKDTEKPHVVDYKAASQYEITLIFNEDVRFKEDKDAKLVVLNNELKKRELEDNKDLDASDIYVDTKGEDILENFYHTNSKDIPYMVEVDGKEVTLYFTDGESKDEIEGDEDRTLPQGTAYVYVDEKTLEDYWENANEDLAYVVEIEKDETAPYITKWETEKQNIIEFTFNEDIYNQDDVQVVVYDNEGKKVSASDYNISFKNSDDDVLVVEFDENIEGKYKFIISKAKDRTGNKMKEATLEFEIEDVTAPVAKGDDDHDAFRAILYSPSNDDQEIIIDFDQAMDVADITNHENFALYKVNDKEKDIEGYDLDADNSTLYNNLEDADFDAIDGNTKVRITLTDDVRKEIGKITSGQYYIKMGRLKDAAGNKMTTYGAAVKVEDAKALKVEAELKDSKTIEVTVKGKILDEFDDDEIFVYAENTTSASALKISSVNADEDTNETTIVVKLDKEQDTGKPLYIEFDEKADIKDEFGAKVPSGKSNRVKTEDEAAPEFDYAYVSSTTTQASITVVFTEDIDPDTVNKKGNVGFTSNDGDIDKVVVNGNEIKLIFDHEEKKDIEKVDKYTNIYYNGNEDIADAKDNEVEKFSETDDLETKKK